MKIYSIILVLLLVSCGSRKVAINEQKREVVVETSSVVTSIDTSNVEIKSNYSLDTFTIEAKDNLKPFVYKGQTYHNVVLKQEKKVDNSLYKKNTKAVKTDLNQSRTDAKEEIKAIQSERKSNGQYLWIILILLILLIISYRKLIRLIFTGL